MHSPPKNDTIAGENYEEGAMQITKAIIPVAGWGARRLPITRAIEKCMLPIGNRPVIDYVVQDCVMAGITEIYFVVNGGESQLERFYSRNIPLETYLQNAGKTEYLRYALPPENIKFYYIDQDSTTKYGTAIPVGLCAPYIKPGESVAVLMGDDFIFNRDGSSELAHLLRETPDGGCAMLGVNVPLEQVNRYGVIEFDQNGNYYQIVEKPEPEQAPSTFINVSKFVINYELLQAIAAYANVEISGEYYITDPINQFVLTGGQMKVVQANGQYLDAGDVYSWLYANDIILGRA